MTQGCVHVQCVACSVLCENELSHLSVTIYMHQNCERSAFLVLSEARLQQNAPHTRPGNSFNNPKLHGVLLIRSMQVTGHSEESCSIACRLYN